MDLQTTHLVLLLTSLTTLTTTIAGFIYSWYREERIHRWQLDRDRQHQQITAGMAAQLADLHKALK